MLVAILILSSARERHARVVAAGLVALVAVAELLWWNAASRLNAQSRNLYAVLEAPTGAEATAIALLETSIAADHRRGAPPPAGVPRPRRPWPNPPKCPGGESTHRLQTPRTRFSPPPFSP